LTTQDIADIQTVIVETGALQDVETTITSLQHEALAALQQSNIDILSVTALQELADYVTDRID
jgi:geranylgeranyl pyrophosphate synthase